MTSKRVSIFSGSVRRTVRPLLLDRRCLATGANCLAGVRYNAVGIPMMPDSFRQRLFGKQEATSGGVPVSPTILAHLKSHGVPVEKILRKEDSPSQSYTILENILSDFFVLLVGKNIEEHFWNIARIQCESYRRHLDRLSKASYPPAPSQWAYQSGWTKYLADGTQKKVDFPDSAAFFFDVEVLVPQGPLPVLAAALSPTAWYSWCSMSLVDSGHEHPHLLWGPRGASYHPRHLIPLGMPEIVVGHNVAYDRARVREEYETRTPTRFMDTMSMHISVAGLTSFQRSLLQADRSGRPPKDNKKTPLRGPPSKAWMEVSSMNSLKEVFMLYTDGQYGALSKEKRDVFVSGSMKEVRQDFQSLLSYCASDAWATAIVFSKLWPLFCERFPHPVTLAGMLEMSTSYLPAGEMWFRYLRNSESTFDDLNRELRVLLTAKANDACKMMKDNKYKSDPWLSTLDWETQNLKVKKTARLRKGDKKPASAPKLENNDLVPRLTEIQMETHSKLSEEFSDLLASHKGLFSKQPVLPGYPNWYRSLWSKLANSPDHTLWSEPSEISASMQIVPKLLRLTWDGYPLHFDKKYGWGYLVPGRKDNLERDDEASFLEMWAPFLKEGSDANVVSPGVDDELEETWRELLEVSEDPENAQALWRGIQRFNSAMARSKKQKKVQSIAGEAKLKGPTWHVGVGPYDDVCVPGCWFFKLPHKDGEELKVGNPLAKDFMSKINEGILSTVAGKDAERALLISSMISYWRNTRDRALSQIIVWRDPTDLTIGAGIIPQMAVAGTVTRRAVEATWLTASNSMPHRLGSEMKSVLAAPDGYHFVGADVDSQEMWIAALLGDAAFGKMHGCTALGWMSLHGDKASGTDVHSRTAKAVGVTRDQAKVLNYGRIYGAGRYFAERLLRQFNPRLSEEEAKEKAMTIYAETKGVRGYKLNPKGQRLARKAGFSERDAASGVFTARDILRFKRICRNRNELFETDTAVEHDDGLDTYREYADCIAGRVWMGGSESAMFNRLEEIACGDEPRTPVLQSRISRALEPFYVEDDFMTSRVNWVVQSSAVDFLHLLLVNMRYLIDTLAINSRFSISIHDEVRYLVKSEDKDRVAFCLELSNLFTRAMFSSRIGIPDLPLSVCFFSSVEVDRVIRKEPQNPAVSPSNPHGLEKGYGIPPGESVELLELIQRMLTAKQSRTLNPAVVLKKRAAIRSDESR